MLYHTAMEIKIKLKEKIRQSCVVFFKSITF